MHPVITRLLAGIFVCLSLAGCPTPAPAKPRPRPPVEVLWYTWDWNDPAALDPAALQAAGVSGVLAVSTHHFDPQNRALSLDELRADAKAIQGRCGTLSVWWTFNVVRQAGNPTASSPARTLCDPRDAAARVQLLGNYASIGRVARELGFAGLALDTEMFGGGAGAWPDEKGARELGQDLARSCRQNYPTLKLAAFGPLAGSPPGFRKVWRGFNEAATDAVFFDEDTYNLSSGIDARKALQKAGEFTGAKYPAAGWFASTRAPNVAGWFQAAVPGLQAATQVSPYVMVYREGPMQAAHLAALRSTLEAL